MIARDVRGGEVPVRVCVGVDGLVDTAMMVPTGFAGFDLDLLNAVGTWRHTPFTIDGVPAPVCSLVVFKFEVRRPTPE